MPIPEKNTIKKPRESEEDKDEATTLALCELAMALALAREAADAGGAAVDVDGANGTGGTDEQAAAFRKLIKRSLHQKKDEVLYDALARTEALDARAGLVLKKALEEAAEATVIERAEGKRVEINAFVVPLFLHTTGGLDAARCFQDQPAFEALTKSFQDGLLESPAATVVLVNHGYHLNEIDGITFSHLHEMLRDAFVAMTDKRVAATPAIDRSFGGWPDSPFGAGDRAIELRFLLGFSLKAVDDPFYLVPDDDAAADAYFQARAARFQQWTAVAAPLVKRCFGIDEAVATGATTAPGPSDGPDDGAQGDVHFLYQDLFHGGKEQGIAEYFMLQMLSELNRGLQTQGVLPSAVRAVFGPVTIGEEAQLRVRLDTLDGKLVVQATKPVPAMPDWETEFADANDALLMIGVREVSSALRFEQDGTPVGVTAYHGGTASGAT